MAAAKIPEAGKNQLGNGLFPHRNQRLGQNFGVGVQPRAKAARHHHDGDIHLFAVVHIHAARKHNIGDDAVLVQNGQGINAKALQLGAGAAALGHRQAVGVIIGSLGQRGAERAAAQDTLADIPICHNGLQLALRRNKQDALARFIQLFHRIQHRAGLRNKKFFDFQVKYPLGKVGVRK